MTTVLEEPADLLKLVGQRIGTSDWMKISQDQVDRFADATGDKQWIHTDLQRAAKGPFRGTIGGRYELCGEIASGGMATVHIARQVGAAGFARIVAIKRLHERYARDPEFVAMFLDEARIVARIRHPNVASVLGTLLGRAPLLAQTMYYFKPPGGKGQGMHQDNFYLLAAPATCIA